MSFPDWAIGVILSVVGSIILNIGVNIMKYSHMQNSLRALQDRKFYLLQPMWWGGGVLFALGNAMDFAALGLAAQSVIAPLGGVSLVSNSVMAPLFLKEAFTRVDGVANTLVICGAVLAVVFGTKEQENYDIEALKALFNNPVLWVYWALVAVITIAMLVSAFIMRKQLVEITHMDEERPGRPSVFTRKAKYLPFLHASCAAIIGAQTIIGAKASSELLQESIVRGNNQFSNGWSYLIVVGTALTGLTQVHQFQLALRIADALFVVPFFFVIWTAFSIVGAGIFYEEFEAFQAWQFAAFISGILIEFTGVLLLMRRLRTKHAVNDATGIPVDIVGSNLGALSQVLSEDDDSSGSISTSTSGRDDDDDDGVDYSGSSSSRVIRIAGVDSSSSGYTRSSTTSTS